MIMNGKKNIFKMFWPDGDKGDDHVHNFFETKQLNLIFLVFLYFLPPWNLLRLPDASAKQVLKEMA